MLVATITITISLPPCLPASLPASLYLYGQDQQTSMGRTAHEKSPGRLRNTTTTTTMGTVRRTTKMRMITNGDGHGAWDAWYVYFLSFFFINNYLQIYI